MACTAISHIFPMETDFSGNQKPRWIHLIATLFDLITGFVSLIIGGFVNSIEISSTFRGILIGVGGYILTFFAIKLIVFLVKACFNEIQRLQNNTEGSLVLLQ